jgi:hypothetical protein
MILHSARLTDGRRARETEMKKPKKKPYEKPEVRRICLEDDEALLKLFKQNRENVQELRRIVNALLEKPVGIGVSPRIYEDFSNGKEGMGSALDIGQIFCGPKKIQGSP